jgi:SAM-dependent methyltransferase
MHVEALKDDERRRQNPFVPWRLEWTPDHVTRFWDWYGAQSARELKYFAEEVGDEILDQAAKHVPLTGTVVDVGAGLGHLCEKLLRRGARTIAVDTSAESVAAINERLSGVDGFGGARVSGMHELPLDSGSADVVFLVETVEHLDEATSDAILAEIHRVLRPGGRLVMTTPNEERLADAETMCPDCGCVFHRMQHIRSFSARRLPSLADSAGFRAILCRPTLFNSYRFLPARLHRLLYRRVHGKLPHLLYVGERR